MKKTLALILVLTLLLCAVPIQAFAAELTLESLAWEQLTYRDIFIENNLAAVNGFDQGSWGAFYQNTGINQITGEAAHSQPNSLKVAGTSSQQIVSSVRSSAGTYFVASKVSCTRYVQGKLGLCLQSTPVGVSSVTKGFVTAAGVVTIGSSHSIYIGSIHSANLDGFVDDPVVVNMNIFSTKPTASQLEKLYENFVQIGTPADPEEPEDPDQQSLDAFMDYMQEKARSIGMDSSIFEDPVGNYCNVTTARDVAKLMVCADGYEALRGIWSRKSAGLTVRGPKARTKPVESSVIKPELEQSYQILGGKTGTLDTIRNLTVILEIPGSDDRLVVVALGANGSNYTTVNRYQAAKQIADAAMEKYRNPDADVSGRDVCCASAIACLIPAEGADLHDLQVLYEKDADSRRTPASITKVLTAVCVLDFMDDLDARITYTQFDINTCPWFTEEFYAGDEVTLEDALLALLLPSENITAFTLARSAGGMLLRHMEMLPGDVNGDDTVNALDLILLRQHLAGWEITAGNADANGDGKTDALDLIILRQYLAGWDVTLG